MTDTKPRLGYIGVGLMGGPMTARLLDAGYQVTIWNRTAEKMAPLVAKGAVAADGPAGVAAEADIVMMCLTAAPAVDAVVFGPGGVAEAADDTKILVDFSSMRPDLTREWAEKLRGQTGMGWVDAPVSGGVPGAEKGTLAIMGGGTQADYDRVAPVIEAVASRFTLMGPNGAGQVTKLANQIISGSMMMIIAECVGFAKRAGVDAARIPEALKGGFADSTLLQLLAPRFAAETYEPKLGALETMIKDLDTIADVARANNMPIPVTSQVLQVYRLLASKGLQDEDITALTKIYSETPFG
ncbi:MAG: NAD(P)-dependent oxidoreductase [Bauldia litoralis]